MAASGAVEQNLLPRPYLPRQNEAFMTSLHSLLSKDHLLIDGILLATPAVIVLGSLLLTSDAHWFGRSGALVVLSGAFLEYRCNLLMNPQPSTSVMTEGQPAPKTPGTLTRGRKNLSLCALLLICSGTVIWGYGDLFF